MILLYIISLLEGRHTFCCCTQISRSVNVSSVLCDIPKNSTMGSRQNTTNLACQEHRAWSGKWGWCVVVSETKNWRLQPHRNLYPSWISGPNWSKSCSSRLSIHYKVQLFTSVLYNSEGIKIWPHKFWPQSQNHIQFLLFRISYFWRLLCVLWRSLPCFLISVKVDDFSALPSFVVVCSFSYQKFQN